MRVVRKVFCCSLVVILAAIVAVFAAPLPTPDTWAPFGSNSNPESAQFVRLPANPAELNARIRIPGLMTTTVTTSLGPRLLLELAGGGITNEIGAPRLPVLRYMLETPPGATVVPSLHPLDLKTRSLESFGWTTPLFAVQMPVPKLPGAEEAAVYQENPVIFGADRLFPKHQIEVIDQAIIRGRWVTTLEIRPFRYNPVQKVLEYWTEAELAVQFTGDTKSKVNSEASRLRSPAHDQALSEQLIPLAAPTLFGIEKGSGGGAAEGAEGLLIVVNDSLVDSIAPLVEWRKKTGWKVEVLKTSTIGTNPTDSQIKSAIDSRYRSWSNPSLGFLLLVGDTNLVAKHTGNGGGNSQAADNWYGCLDGNDYLPEIAMGRISTRTAQETSDVVAKLMTYHKATFPSDAWVKKTGFIGTSDSGHITQIESTHDYCINTYMTPNGYQKTSWSHGGSSSDRHYNTTKATTADISNSINDGRSIFNYSGHGGETSWQGPTSNGGYDQANVRANTNADMYPFVIGNACVTNKFDIDECFGETWLKVPNKGAIGYWGASNNSYWDEDDYLQRSLYTHIFPMDSTPALGIILNKTKLDNYNHFGNVGSTAYYYDMYNLLGDPTTSLWTRQPMTMSVTYPSGIPLGETKLDVTVTGNGQPLANALVAVRKPGEAVFEGAYTDAQGSLTLALDPAPKDIGNLELTVTRHDYRPFEATITIFRPDTPWLAHRSHQIQDAAPGGDGDGSVNPGETFVMPVILENLGTKPASGIVTTLTTNTPTLATILDGAANFPDAGPTSQVTSLPDHFKVQIPESASDNQVVGFDLHWQTAEGTQGTTSFTELIKAVNLDVSTTSVDDSAGGNGNGVAGPGETVNLTITLANTGHKDAFTIHGKLTTASPYATVLNGEADFPNLPAGATGASLPPVYRIQFSPSAPDSKPVLFQLEVTEQGSHYTKTFPINLMVSSCAKSDAIDVPKPINDNSTVESRFDYPNSITINEVNVFVDISHSYIGDIKVTLVSPNGTTVLLHNKSGGSNDGLVTWYDTETQPAEPLSKLNGENSAGTWILRVEDLSSGDSGTLNGWKLEICGDQAVAAPKLQFAGKTVNDSGSCDPDGFADVGELVTYKVAIKNNGSLSASGVQASLSSTSRIEVLNNPVTLPNLAPGAQAEATFKVRIGAVACRENAAFTLNLTANEGSWVDGFKDTLEADLSNAPVTENLEHGGAAPAGWTHSAISGTDDWQVSANYNHTTGGAYSWFVSDTATTKDVVLVSPVYQIGGTNSTFEFWHRVDLQGQHDGGVLEVTTDGGSTWQDMETNIISGGYHNTILAGPLKDRKAWTGPRGASWIDTVVNLDPYAGKSIQIRFRLGCDDNTKLSGWNIDDIVIRTTQQTCDSHPCGIPGEAQALTVMKDPLGARLDWKADALAIRYRIFRSADPTHASAFVDATPEDSNPSDTTFIDQTNGTFSSYIITVVGPDQEGPWGHFGQ